MPEECSNIVVAFGNTGSGKSTLLGSMIVGSNNLQKKDIKNGKWIQRVIDYKEGVEGPFPIGHQYSQS